MYQDFAHVQAATIDEFDTAEEAFTAAQALVQQIRGSEYAFHNFERIRAERNDVTTGHARWRGFVDYAVVAAAR